MYGLRMTTPEVTPHCECCGRERPDTSEGYTACCNELVCHGHPRTWTVQLKGGKEVKRTACCAGRLEKDLDAAKVAYETFWR